MSFKFKKKQRGAVLAFGLVMLLLLTLTSLSMIRQNKVQINIATNTGNQVTAFASVETALRHAQAVLETRRIIDVNNDGFIDGAERDAHHCKSGVDFPVHTIPNPYGMLVCDSSVQSCANLPAGIAVNNPPNINATVQAIHCITNYVKEKGGGNEAACLYSFIDNATGHATDCTNPNNWVRNKTAGSILNPPILDEGTLCPTMASPAEPSTLLPATHHVSACEKLDNAGDWVAGNPKDNACAIEVYTVHVKLLDEQTNTQRTVESKFEIDCSNDLNP
jgi:hypothetical protein